MSWYGASRRSPGDVDPWLTQAVELGDLRRTITASGSLTPVNVVQVGTQVSGTIARLHVDFNTQVKPGQLLAELDTTALDAELAQSQAQLSGAQAALELAQSNAVRQQELFDVGFISRSGVDQALASALTAQATLDQQRAQLRRIAFNRRNAEIRSPVAGTVISREVSIGQTVAAALQTPVLFRIAQDLREMQIEASVAEADVGLLSEGQPVRFSVDAFPERMFEGRVRQIRNNHQVQQNVVTYTAVVSMRNEDSSLRPGMTAYIVVTVAERRGVMRIPNAALRYLPADDSLQHTGTAAELPHSTVWLWPGSGSHPRPVAVGLGLSDGRWTEMTRGELRVGDRLVVGARKAQVSFGPKIF